MTHQVERLTSEQASAFLSFSDATLRASRCTGRLAGVAAPAFVKVGRSVRYDRETLSAWLSQFGNTRTGG